MDTQGAEHMSHRTSEQLRHEIADRKRAEVNLREALQYTRSLIEASLDPLVTISPEGRITDVNQATEAVTGAAREQLIGSDFSEYFTEPDKAREGYQQVYSQGTVTDYPLTIRHASGRLTDVLYNASVYKNESGEVQGVFAAARNISDLKRAEQRYRVLFESSRDAIMTIAPPSWKFTSGNPATIALFGVEDETTFTSLGPWDLSPETQPDGRPSAQKAKEMIETAMREGSHMFEWTHKRLGGEEFPTIVLLTRMEIGSQTLLQATIRDITKRKRAEQQLEEYATALEGQKAAVEELCGAAEAANQAKSEFLANMSHEIRTPLTAILGFTDVILEASREPQVQDAATTIKRNGRHLLGVINDVLDLSKIEAGKLRMDLERCSPCQVVADVVSMMRVRADGKGLALGVSYRGPIPETIETDAARLRQILLNLLGNAVKFTELGQVELCVQLADGGEKGVRTLLPERPGGCFAQKGPDPFFARLRFDVVDTGIGMTDQQTAELFQPFHQVDTSASRRFGGTGLGLAISKRLAEMLGGTLTVESKPGRGSTFSLTIATGPLDDVPMSSPTEEAAAAPPEARKPSRPAMPKLTGRILLAEDGPDNQRLISFLLKKAGAAVVLAENGQEAMEKALAALPGYGRRYSDRREPIDLVLMDIQMPVMDGLEATRRLREAGYDRPILALTAHAMKHDVRKCLDAGCDAHLAKPIEREEFIATVARFLDAGQADSTKHSPELSEKTDDSETEPFNQAVGG